MFVCSRSFYLLLNEKVFFIQYKYCIDTRFSKCSSQEFAGFTVCEKFPSILYYLSISISLSIHRSIVRSCDRKFVFSVLSRSYKEKGTFKSQLNLSFGGRNDSTQPNRKTVITTELFSFLSVEKNHSPFSLNFVYGPQSSHRDQ